MDKPSLKIGNIGSAGDIVNGDKNVAGGDVVKAENGSSIKWHKDPNNRAGLIISVIVVLGVIIGIIADWLSIFG